MADNGRMNFFFPAIFSLLIFMVVYHLPRNLSLSWQGD